MLIIQRKSTESVEVYQNSVCCYGDFTSAICFSTEWPVGSKTFWSRVCPWTCSRFVFLKWINEVFLSKAVSFFYEGLSVDVWLSDIRCKVIPSVSLQVVHGCMCMWWGKQEDLKKKWGLPCTRKSQLNFEAVTMKLLIFCLCTQHKECYIKRILLKLTRWYIYFFTGSVGKSADSAFLSASVDDPDDAFVGFTYVPPTDLTEW